MTEPDRITAEQQRLDDEVARKPGANWKRWGPYLSERQWGTVREDMSDDARPWMSLTHDEAVWTAYRWGEDGLLGISDRQGRLCFSLALWNGKDPILKERLFGLSGPEGNHGEDVKECYYYLDATPTHSYLKGLYKYPHGEYPYQQLRDENKNRTRVQTEYELLDTGLFDQHRYFDVTVEYAKGADEDIAIRITIANRGPEAATLRVLPTVWFRNTWSWPEMFESKIPRPSITGTQPDRVAIWHQTLGEFQCHADVGPDGEQPQWLFTENVTNSWRDSDSGSRRPSCKDAFHLYVVDGLKSAVNTKASGTKAAVDYSVTVPVEGEVSLRLRLSRKDLVVDEPFSQEFDDLFANRITEADAFYASKLDHELTEDESRVHRQANAGLIWTKQFYYYSVDDWLKANPNRQPRENTHGVRNKDWEHLFNRDIISMPDKWEYPWYAAWDSAFHMIPFARIDGDFAKEQMRLFLREWYMHPNGQLPAYEWNFSDVNPPVHAWACWRVYQASGEPGKRDRVFLERTFQKLLLNFTWWVNRKDVRGQHVFSGGFLGLDNIGIFDRSRPLPGGSYLEQADGTAWMAFYCAAMLTMALELAPENKAYEDMASKFFEHYIAIAEAMNFLDGSGLWDEKDGFYYDHLHANGHNMPLRIRSLVGIAPLFAVDVISEDVINSLPGFRRRMIWFLKNRSDLGDIMTWMEPTPEDSANEGLRLLGIPTRERLERMLKYVLDEDEFLSPFGIRSLSRFHLENPVSLTLQWETQTIQYVPGESDTWMFGGNSNWRGPIWFPMNYLLIEAFERYHQFYGDSLRVECPTGSGVFMDLHQVAMEIRRRLAKIFLRKSDGDRPCYDRGDRFVDDPHWRDHVLFYEYFHGDTGRGLGASHQTGWTALVAPILEQLSAAGH